MKKKIVAIFSVAFVLCMALVVLAGCSSGSSGGSSSQSTQKKVFNVGFDQDFPPYGYVGDDGKFTGFDLDLAKEVCDRNGWEVNYKAINWDAKDLELNSGSIDCIWNGFTIEGREGAYTFTDPYMENNQVVVVRRDSGITDLSGLAGKTVMAQADSAAMHLLEPDGAQAALAATFKALQSVPEYNSAFMELESGTVDAVAMDLPVAQFQVVGKEDKFVILASTPLSSEHYGVGFKLGNTELRDQVQSTLKKMVADGTVEKIAKKYESQGISYSMWVLPA